MDSRRNFLKKISSTGIAAAATAGLPNSIRAALASSSPTAKKSLKDVEHIVVLMQENRSFDHYFGELNGVRGFKDPHFVGGSSNPVWLQKQPAEKGGKTVGRFNLDAEKGFFADGPHHTRESLLKCWNNGLMDGFMKVQPEHSMGHFGKNEIPFYYELANAFTICDAYHASALANTHLNRTFLMSGRACEEGSQPGTLFDVAFGNLALNSTGSTADKLNGLTTGGFKWKTIAERLEEKKVDWKVYQNGLNNNNSLESVAEIAIADGILRKIHLSQIRKLANGNSSKEVWTYLDDLVLAGDNYNCNALSYFSNFSDNSNKNRALREKGCSVNSIKTFCDEAKAGKLPAVSWIIPPLAFSEHPGAKMGPAMGELLVSTILEALSCNKDAWNKTVFFITYDEGDGWFDHMPPPMPLIPGKSKITSSNPYANEIEKSTNKPVGLGTRVPMIVVSPWTTGGKVSSEVFDHTSIVRFICKRHEIPDDFVNEWRRKISGDLTSLFNFSNTEALDKFPAKDLSGFKEFYGKERKIPTFPKASEMEIPQEAQDSAQRTALPTPYQLSDKFTWSGLLNTGSFKNSGDRHAVFQVFDNENRKVSHYTVGKDEDVTHFPSQKGEQDISIFGPNGFFREYKRSKKNQMPTIQTQVDGEKMELILTLTLEDIFFLEFGLGRKINFKVTNKYDNSEAKDFVSCKEPVKFISVPPNNGWYDIEIIFDENASSPCSARFAGHIENGKESKTDPHLSS